MRLIFNLLPLLNLEQKSFLILFFLTFFTVFLEVISIGSIVPVVLFFFRRTINKCKIFFFSFSSDFLSNLSDREIIKYILIFIFFAFSLKNLLLIYIVFWKVEFHGALSFFLEESYSKSF